MNLGDLKRYLRDRGVKFPVYLDYQATTPVDKCVFDAMTPYFLESFGSPGSGKHSFAFEAEAAVDLARSRIADVISVDKSSIIFTSSATEANNLAIFGLCSLCSDIITLSTEHKSVLEPIRYLEKNGIHATYLPVTKSGIVDLSLLEEEVKRSIKNASKRVLVSVMAVNNEIGVISQIEEIGSICNKLGALFHTDIAQAFGKIKLDMHKCNIDLATISAHKIYGPKGIGALYIRQGISVNPMIYGGGQEYGIRASTLPVALIVGFGHAAMISRDMMQNDYNHLKELYNLFLNIIHPSAKLNGDRNMRWPGNINITLSKQVSIRDIATSSGSACTSNDINGSHVLRAIGLDIHDIKKTMRIGFGRYTTREEVEYAACIISESQELQVI